MKQKIANTEIAGGNENQNTEIAGSNENQNAEIAGSNENQNAEIAGGNKKWRFSALTAAESPFLPELQIVTIL